ncbi:MAG TPA: ABC transporter ATP-binding protein [Candidatus Eisenbergiella merdipullorum]|uniref:ABC transporter ATP-binding protein n=1 Tax=Candidatus Eisenbergiella merdipullorum TaxID=2838553 RepID=A0A9D2I8Q4_9FIRM|nr:ABC transporter ATP-binding protein [Candidatus Eisenbergiella merdipullorum]
MITVEHITKTYRIARRDAGFLNACKSLFHREYDEIRALDDISFTIQDGEMVGYIGPNGAGKSSTIKILSGILTPDCGTCLVNGRVPWKDRIRHASQIGVVFGQRTQLWWDVPVADSFDLLKDIYRIDPALYRKNRDELTELLDLSQLLRTPARQLSLGQRMRCEIAASLLHSPKVLFLDEPTIGLDAVSKLAVRSFIRHLNETRRTTVILTPHDMQDIEALASRILLIGKGKILMDGTLDDIRRGGESIDETLAALYQQYEI